MNHPYCSLRCAIAFDTLNFVKIYRGSGVIAGAKVLFWLVLAIFADFSHFVAALVHYPLYIFYKIQSARWNGTSRATIWVIYISTKKIIGQVEKSHFSLSCAFDGASIYFDGINTSIMCISFF